jgi:mono/diheme cytochrome c family protein
MPHHFASRGTLVLAAVLVVAACSSSTQGAASAPAPAAAKSALPTGVTAQMVAVGDSLFKAGSCKRCHGPDAKGTGNGANLTDSTWTQISGSYPEIVQIITEGVPKEKVKLATAQFAMRPRGGSNLTDDQIKNIAAYVYSISHH